MIIGAIFAFLVLAAIFFFGFFLGYRGGIRDTAKVAMLIAAFFLAPQALQIFFYGGAPGVIKVLSGIFITILLVTAGSLTGTLYRKVIPVKKALLSHAGIIAGTAIGLEIIELAYRHTRF